MLFTIERNNIENLYFILREIEGIYYLRHEDMPINYDEVAEIYTFFAEELRDFTIFEVYLILRALPRLPKTKSLTPKVEMDIRQILQKSNMMRQFPAVEEAAAVFFDFSPDSVPDEDYMSAFYDGFESSEKEILDYHTFCIKLLQLYEHIFCSCRGIIKLRIK